MFRPSSGCTNSLVDLSAVVGGTRSRLTNQVGGFGFLFCITFMGFNIVSVAVGYLWERPGAHCVRS
jgi:hypothetical protein